MTSQGWNRVIDEVAREMTAGVPASEFRARVVEQVSITPQTGRLAAFASTWRFASAVAACVLTAAIAFTVIRPPQNAAPQPGAAYVPVSATPQPVAADDSPYVGRPGLGAGMSRPRPAPQQPAALVEWRARRIPALEGVAALEMARIQPADLSVSQLSVTPLGIAPIVIPSIDEQR
jgi:hypothetical protein